jgi:hypothetical protein
MMPVHDDGGRVRSYSREHPDQLSMVLETGDGGRQDIEDVAHREPPLSSVVEEGSYGGHDGSVAAFFQQLQLHDHGSESDTPPPTTTLTRKLQRLNHQQQLQPMLQQSCSSLFPLRRRLARSESPRSSLMQQLPPRLLLTMQQQLQ